MQRLQQRVYLFALFNLFLVTVIGLLLRAVPITGLCSFSYKNILHGHSHFAFGGWVMPAILSLLLKHFPEFTGKVTYTHWRNAAILLLTSAYGMLASFPLQGYGVVSICFSTLSILGSFYLAWIIWRSTRGLPRTISHRFLLAGVFYLVLSAAGPLATGPLAAAGKTGTSLYFNVIYFYLHFQYNGWFCFALLAILYKIIGEKKNRYGNNVFMLLNLACAPAYFLSVLWSHPSLVFYIFGAIAACLQMPALFYLLADIVDNNTNRDLNSMIRVSLFAFAFKIILQLLSAFPVIADMGYHHRNFIIAYLHLVLLGFVSFFILGSMELKELPRKTQQQSARIFIVTWIITELLLVSQAFGEVTGLVISSFPLWLFIASCPFTIATFSYWLSRRSNHLF